MVEITVRPDIRAAGGEASDLLLDGRFVGTMTLVYQEGNRLAGAVQLDKDSLAAHERSRVMSFVEQHVFHLSEALRTDECEVIVTCSTYTHVINGNREGIETTFDTNDAFSFADGKSAIRKERRTYGETDDFGFRLQSVSAGRNVSTYEIVDEDDTIVAAATIKQFGADIVGELRWPYMPSEEEIDCAADLLIRDFDDTLIDTIVLDIKVEDDIVETIELTHESLLDEERERTTDGPYFEEDGLFRRFALAEEDSPYDVELIRDDGDVLTYHIYGAKTGALPLGEATIDISGEQLSGFIDFHTPGTGEEREVIAGRLLLELDKEKQFDSVHLTMLFKNQLIDEMMFQQDTIH
ncbi:hypothetical protein [Paenibacillus sp. MSJ-34]|uniref:hypothetical protein n=1 Tax=Paenibacillus sp. MSJ-34 TaxID=2841529 RepID=UPI001C11AFF6|nr:hypothetical protein [Paenibacillus sp. MSJ-34]MBU5442114.1 hypothetical protein [Paenibacillus sp. MSJ-34]